MEVLSEVSNDWVSDVLNFGTNNSEQPCTTDCGADCHADCECDGD